MTFLAPWALALGAAGALGALLLHLVARHRPAAYLLPTTRFIPDRRMLVSRAASRPRDLLLLALRMLLLLAAGAAFARPVFTRAHDARARIILVDRSAAVASDSEVSARLRAVLGDGVPSTVIDFDSIASPARLARADDSMPRRETRANGSISAALVAARRAAAVVGATSGLIELVLVSPVAAEELDAATPILRAMWPGAVRVERMATRADSAGAPLERAVSIDDPLGPALADMRVLASPRAIRLVRGATIGARDSAFAASGGTVVAWDSTSAPLDAQGLAIGDDVVVATLGRRLLAAKGEIVARWADGSPAAREETLGRGCVRTVGVALPRVGDLPLRPSFQRIVRALVAPCAAAAATHPADSASVARLGGGRRFVPSNELSDATATTSPIVPWLLGVALLCALLELALRGRPAREDVA
jgi:hypothetical protein